MSLDEGFLEDSAEELFEEAPCGYLTTDIQGTILRVNRTFEQWSGRPREKLLGLRRFQDLLAPGGRIYYDTHFAPLLHMQGWVREIALDVTRADGTLMPALVNSTLRRDSEGAPRAIRITVFDASDRRRYEKELLRGRDQEREIATRLQRSLLAGALPEGPDFQLGVTYLPAVAGLEVGGDWYDAFWLGERSIAIVVGDVVGRGLEAAAAMGQLRSAVRALASTGLAPGALLEALDAYVFRHEVGHVATVAYAEVDLDANTLCLACAGHMPPAVVGIEGDAWYVSDGRSTPLAVYSGATTRPQTRFDLPAGALVVMYTDGLVEHRCQSLQLGLDALLERVADSRSSAAQDASDNLVAGMLEVVGRGDDICVVTLRRPL